MMMARCQREDGWLIGKLSSPTPAATPPAMAPIGTEEEEEEDAGGGGEGEGDSDGLRLAPPVGSDACAVVTSGRLHQLIVSRLQGREGCSGAHH